ncbi:MAG TPA: pyridine nucleotide-disulfide oxidoreductase [Aerococcus urinaeequi]|nr:pyridine nucleotide-disulfide oxidoreductase [Aerococcus urinaeequi]
MVNISKVKVICRTTRVFKPVIDAKTNEILWLRLFGEGAHKIITVSMKAHLPYTSLRDQIYTHPTLAEGLNDLFAIVD